MPVFQFLVPWLKFVIIPLIFFALSRQCRATSWFSEIV
jgi:hypothetical protein